MALGLPPLTSLIVCGGSACASSLTFMIFVHKMFRSEADALNRAIFSLTHFEEVNAKDLQNLHGVAEGLHDLQKIIRHEHSLATGLWRGIPMAYLLVDTKERAIGTNQTCLDMLEITDSVQKCLGKTLSELFYNEPNHETAVGKSMREGTVFQNLEVTIHGHKGRKTHVLANVFPVCESDGTCIGGLCLYADITRLKEAEIEIVGKNAKLTETAGLLKETSQTVLTRTTELSTAIEQNGKNADQASQMLSGTASAMNEMNQTVQEIARKASEASQSSEETREKARSGSAIVEKSLTGIQAVRDISEQLRSEMSQLNDHAQSISQIMGVISDIADQTNLLALNAAIEAARAGESGRGFAVVADEVRKLAEKTMASTTDVGHAIEQIQERTEKCTNSMDHALEKVSQATELAGQSGQALTEILATVDGTASQVDAIAAACEEQSAASREITDSIASIDEMVRESAKAMTSVASAVTGLASQADDLNGLVKRLES